MVYLLMIYNYLISMNCLSVVYDVITEVYYGNIEGIEEALKEVLDLSNLSDENHTLVIKIGNQNFEICTFEYNRQSYYTLFEKYVAKMDSILKSLVEYRRETKESYDDLVSFNEWYNKNSEKNN